MIYIGIKHDVDLAGIRPEMVAGLLVIASVFMRYDCNLTITCVRDGTHKRGSLHYVGQAIDIRRPYDLPEIKDELQRTLGPQFDVVEEINHIHIEFQPKERL